MISDAHDMFYGDLRSWTNTQGKTYAKCQEILNYYLNIHWQNLLVITTYQKEMTIVLNSVNENNATLENDRIVRNFRQEHINYRRFRFPSLRSRFIAEVIDICFMFIIKLILIRLIVGSQLFSDYLNLLPFDFLNGIPGYRLFRLFHVGIMTYNTNEDINVYTQVLQSYSDFLKPFQSDVLLGPIIVWFLVRMFCEIYLISQPVFDNRPGGCSVGKYMMNLRVVSCSHRVMLPDAVDIYPAGDPGCVKSFIRAVLKNSNVFMCSSILQMILTGDQIFSYDVLACTIVVENNEEDI